jgi:hypothetical protein
VIHLALWLWAAMFLGSLGLVALIGIGALAVNVLGWFLELFCVYKHGHAYWRPWCKYLPGHGLAALGWVAVSCNAMPGALICWAMAAGAYIYAANPQGRHQA